jgi:hypothetical protein
MLEGASTFNAEATASLNFSKLHLFATETSNLAVEEEIQMIEKKWLT